MEPEIQTILENNEKVIWEGKQDLKSTILTTIFSVLLVIGFGLLFSFFGSLDGGTCLVNGQPAPLEECSSMANYFSYGLYAVAFFIVIGSYLHYKVTRYLITNKRLILKSGLIGADMRSVYYDQIRSVFVNVGIIGKIFGTGSVMIDTGRITQSSKGRSKQIYDRFSNIKNPYEVYKFVQTQLSNRKEGLGSGRADFEGNKGRYKDYVQETERFRREVK